MYTHNQNIENKFPIKQVKKIKLNIKSIQEVFHRIDFNIQFNFMTTKNKIYKNLLKNTTWIHQG